MTGQITRDLKRRVTENPRTTLASLAGFAAIVVVYVVETVAQIDIPPHVEQAVGGLLVGVLSVALYFARDPKPR